MSTRVHTRRRCTVCHRPCPPDLRCICEMGAEQEVLDQALAAVPTPPSPEPTETLFRRDWRFLAILATCLVVLVGCVSLMRLQAWGDAEVRSWSPADRMEVSR